MIPRFDNASEQETDRPKLETAEMSTGKLAD